MAGESLPSWTSTLADAAACGAAFAGAGALAAFMTEPDVTRGRRIAALAAILALLPAALAFSIARSGL
ncbi:hypothetical protein E1286_19985 [Nonomuraea terrae]|uniref:Uncharacterized protein n=1 Tax=Nonomuraea terrae TaxID=2530383 RepID=A0A4R4YNT9_9ACTN|nr:hypothetical protein E1286_19985 [Nonomuraea terrae]